METRKLAALLDIPPAEMAELLLLAARAWPVSDEAGAALTALAGDGKIESGSARQRLLVMQDRVAAFDRPRSPWDAETEEIPF